MVLCLVTLAAAALLGAAPAAANGLRPTGSGPPDFTILANGFETGDIVLPFGATGRTLIVQFSPVHSRADLVLSLDTTGSMGGEIGNVRNGLATIITTAQASVSDTQFAVASWRDFPIAPFGNAGDLPWQLLQATTSNTTALVAALGPLAAAGGGDLPESGYEALYQLGTGAGIAYTGGSVPAYTGAGLGGVGFRSGSVRVVAHITDASSHLNTDYTTIPNAHSSTAALDALVALGVRVVPILSDNMVPADTALAEMQLKAAASFSGADVPPCGFVRVAGCAPTQCCTGINGGGEAPTVSGRCPLRFRISSTGAGAATAINLGMNAIVKYGTHQVIATASDDGAPGTPDTTCFIDRIEADAFLRPPQEPEASCVPEATPVSIGGAGYDDGFSNLATGTTGANAGTALQFVVGLGNLCVASTGAEQALVVNLDLADTLTGELLARRTLTVVVPAN
jgi:hypothetical protein